MNEYFVLRNGTPRLISLSSDVDGSVGVKINEKSLAYDSSITSNVIIKQHSNATPEDTRLFSMAEGMRRDSDRTRSPETEFMAPTPLRLDGGERGPATTNTTQRMTTSTMATSTTAATQTVATSTTAAPRRTTTSTTGGSSGGGY